jgi:hypothetical protein
MDEYDSPWKKAIDVYFEPFLAFFFPELHAEIDWRRGHESLDKEFQQIVRKAKLGRRTVDMLLKVWLKDGREQWFLIHVEVQTSRKADFPKRMYVCNYRIFDRYNREVVSLAILADGNPGWRPASFSYGFGGCRAGLWFPVVKLVDYVPRWEALEKDPNPFAMVVLAHLKTRETRQAPGARHAWKVLAAAGRWTTSPVSGAVVGGDRRRLTGGEVAAWDRGD